MIVLVIVLAVLVLLSRLRLGGVVEWSQRGLGIWVRVGPFRPQVFPLKPKEEKKEKPKKPKKEKPPKEKKDGEKPKGGVVDLVVELLPTVLETVKRFCRGLRMDLLEMELTVGAADPADAAMLYGQANALLGSLWEPIVQVFQVEDGHAHVGIDFGAQAPALYLKASLFLTLGQLLTLGIVFAFKALAAFLRVRRRQKNKLQAQKAAESTQEREAA